MSEEVGRGLPWDSGDHWSPDTEAGSDLTGGGTILAVDEDREGLRIASRVEGMISVNGQIHARALKAFALLTLAGHSVSFITHHLERHDAALVRTRALEDHLYKEGLVYTAIEHLTLSGFFNLREPDDIQREHPDGRPFDVVFGNICAWPRQPEVVYLPAEATGAFIAHALSNPDSDIQLFFRGLATRFSGQDFTNGFE